MTKTKSKGPNLTHNVIVKAPGLLPMEYKISELSEELDVPISTLRDWIKDHGLPCTKDNRGYVWIIGTRAKKWVEKNRKIKSLDKKLSTNEALCMHCKKVVEMIDPIMKSNKGKLVHYNGTCPECGNATYRGGRIPETR
jgi:hypothetical protein